MSDIAARIAALPEEQRASLVRALRDHHDAAERSSGRFDVAVLGGGLAGLTLALQLTATRPGTRVAVIERGAHPAPEAAHKVGESTVEIGASYLRDILGLQEHLSSAQLRKFGLRMFFSDGDNRDIARRTEIGSTVFPALATYQVDRGRLENALGERIRQQGIEFLQGTTVDSVAIEADASHHRVRTSGRSGEREILARWVVDASGRRRLLQRQLGLGKRVGHEANAVWFRVGHPIDIKEWTEDPDWQERVSNGDRALSTNHLMGLGYWVWLIRLASGSISIGIVTDPTVHAFDSMNRLDRALDWLHAHEPQCARAIEPHRGKVQDFHVMKDYSYSVRQIYSGEARWALTGEAGVFLDPLYSPGIDMIAIGNGLIVDLVRRHLDGDDVRVRAATHDSLFLQLTEIWLAVYERQYSLMGSAQIMVSKIIWDTAFYWGVFGLLHFQDRFRTLVDNPAVAGDLARLAVLSSRVQEFFREWHHVDPAAVSDPFVDLYAPLNFMVDLHNGMGEDLGEGRFERRFNDNVRLFEQLAGQLISTVMQTYANYPDNPGAFEQIQRWQTEPLIAELIATYRRQDRISPTSDGWMTVGRRTLEVSR